MKHILYLSYTGMTDPLGQSQVLAYLRNLSATHPYRFTIISFEKPDRMAQGKELVEGICRESDIAWHPLAYTARPPVLSTFRDVRAMRQLAMRLHQQRAFDLVHCRSYIPALTGLRMKRALGLPFLFDMRGFWADERVDGNIWRLSNPLYRAIYRYFKRKEKQFLAAADQVVSLTHAAKAVIQSWPSRSAPISVIPCCADFALFDPASVSDDERGQLRESLGIPPDAWVLSYLGTLGTWYMLPEMLGFFRTLLTTEPAALLLFITNDKPAMVFAEARAAGLPEDRIRVAGARRQEVPLYLSLSHASLFFIKPAFSKKASSPVKQGELMAMGIPVVCNDGVGDTSPIVRDNHAGVVLEAFDDQAYAAGAQALRTGQYDAAAIRERAVGLFSLQSGVEKYAAVYQTILGS